MLKYLISNEDMALYVPRRNFFSILAYLRSGYGDKEATFDLYVKELPHRRNYLVAAGLEEAIQILLNFKFSPDDITWLKTVFPLTKEEEKFFLKFRFSGDIWGLDEGTICFPFEPLMRLTGKLVELQLFEAILFNVVGFQTMIASKIARIFHSAKPNGFIVGELRTQGLEAAVKIARSGYITGMTNMSLLLAQKWYDSPSYGGTASHFFISSYPTEIDAFRAYLSANPLGSVMVDTYDVKTGVENVIVVAKEMEQRGEKLHGIVLDSGDLLAQSIMAREMLDTHNLQHVKIIGMSNLDEYKISDLKGKGSKIDFYGMVTDVVTSADSPKLEIVYKIAEVKEPHGWVPKAKFSENKETYAGRKQVFRKKSGSFFSGDIIALEEESCEGGALLQKFVEDGALVKVQPNLQEIREHFIKQCEAFPPGLFDLHKEFHYPIQVSEGVKDATSLARKNHYQNTP
ncbi:MAG TPA: nicotinate phosphoribosyltransferase [Candidatus Paceibacterota bacterium]